MIGIRLMKKSLLVLAYNEESYLNDVINSYSSLFNEIIVVNDKSTDSTQNILLKLENLYPNLNVINNQKILELESLLKLELINLY